MSMVAGVTWKKEVIFNLMIIANKRCCNVAGKTILNSYYIAKECNRQGRRRRGVGGPDSALLKTVSVDPPDSRMKWPKSGVFSRILGYFGVGWPPCRRFDPPPPPSPLKNPWRRPW